MADPSLKRDSPHQHADQGTPEARAWAHDLNTTVKQARTRASVVRHTSEAETVANQVSLAGSSPQRANGSNELAKHIKLWHANQSDRLPHQQCQSVAAALQGCSGWSALRQGSSGDATLDREALRLATDRLKQFGYTAAAAMALISFVIERYGADEAPQLSDSDRSSIASPK